jgi:phosphate transport system protein
MAENGRHFGDELTILKGRLLVMGQLVRERVHTAMRALVNRNLDQIREVIRGDDEVNAMHLEIDDRSFKLLALYQPMAVDLRTIVSVVKINSDLERVGDLAVNIAEASERYTAHPAVKPLIDLPRMGEIAERMLAQALRSFMDRSIAPAEEVLAEDDLLDALKTQIFRELLTYMLGDPGKIEPSIELILISRHLERVGDHATNIAEDVIFMAEGRDVRHRPPDHIALRDHVGE